MAIGKTLVRMDTRKRDRAAGFTLVAAAHKNGGYVGECIVHDRAGNTLGQYTTPIYRNGANLGKKALAAAEGIRLNLASGFDLQYLPTEICDFT